MDSFYLVWGPFQLTARKHRWLLWEDGKNWCSKLVLRLETRRVYYERLLACWKITQEALHGWDEFYQDREIQSYSLGAFIADWWGTHISMRSALKLTLRSYECLGSASSVFEGYRSSQVYTVYLRLLCQKDTLTKISEVDIETEVPRCWCSCTSKGDNNDKMKFQYYTSGLGPPA